MKSGPKAAPPGTRRVAAEAVEAMRRQLAEATRIADECLKMLDKEGLVVPGSRDNMVLNPHFRAWQTAISIQARLGVILKGDPGPQDEDTLDQLLD